MDLPRRSRSVSAAFAFQGVRSYMDEIIYRTRMPFKVKVIEEKKLKDRYPGPGSYDPQKNTSKSFHYGEEMFGSGVLADSKSGESLVPGPGYYDMS